MNPDREISREVISELLEDAHWAPNHGLTQPWRFHVFASVPARAGLADGLQAIYDEITPEPRRDAEKRNKLGAAPRRAPAVIALLAKVESGGKVAEWEEIAAVACAAQNLMLSAHERGIGSYWSSPQPSCSAEFARWLGHDPAAHRALGLIYLGYALPDLPLPRSTRAPLAERVMWH